MPRLGTLAALLVFSAGAAQAQVSDDVVKIGVLTDLSGPAATATGPGSVTAAQMAAEDFGGKVLGKPIAIISANHQIKPDIAAGIARQMVRCRQGRSDRRRSGLGGRLGGSAGRQGPQEALYHPFDRHRRFPRQILFALYDAVGF